MCHYVEDKHLWWRKYAFEKRFMLPSIGIKYLMQMKSSKSTATWGKSLLFVLLQIEWNETGLQMRKRLKSQITIHIQGKQDDFYGLVVNHDCKKTFPCQEMYFWVLTSRSWTRALTFLEVSGDGELWDASLISVARKFLHFLTFSCISWGPFKKKNNC